MDPSAFDPLPSVCFDAANNGDSGSIAQCNAALVTLLGITVPAPATTTQIETFTTMALAGEPKNFVSGVVYYVLPELLCLILIMILGACLGGAIVGPPRTNRVASSRAELAPVEQTDSDPPAYARSDIILPETELQHGKSITRKPPPPAFGFLSLLPLLLHVIFLLSLQDDKWSARLGLNDTPFAAQAIISVAVVLICIVPLMSIAAIIRCLRSGRQTRHVRNGAGSGSARNAGDTIELNEAERNAEQARAALHHLKTCMTAPRSVG
ncbi:hypothetical protein LTR56_017679 [Elasticomyces elasticus]|nr:hypothetical protein LTR56_017679 [Elasticomyces elasticus]KAK3643780.1 hypothetical protein LTR22_015516 [Elasticomyces elasticus]KAK4912986.1 hypothetical protein LTR49_018633 [Elasticomyces elasticus]KAK5752393.1 hypothetical protein LTS12_017524 [Elasticomyces elasticus]